MELFEYLPKSWRVRPGAGKLMIDASDSQPTVEEWLEEVNQNLIQTAANIQGIVEIWWDGCKRPYRFSSILASIGESELVKQNLDMPSCESLSDVPSLIICEIPELDIINEIFGHEGSSALLRMSDDLGLLTNVRTELTSGIKANDWMKVKDHSQWWPDNELRNYKRRLLSDGQLTNYSYYARLISNGQLCRYTVTTRLVQYRGDLCRLIKTHSVISVEQV